jgi:citrate lyase alpha subunit
VNFLVDLPYTGMNRSETTRYETPEILAQLLFSVRFGSMLGARVVVVEVVVASGNRYATNFNVNTMTAADCTLVMSATAEPFVGT